MVESIFMDRAMDIMRNALNVTSDRNQLITGNIANVDTIGYAPKDLDFKQSLLNAMASEDEASLTRTDDMHYKTGAPNPFDTNVYEQSSVEAVDIDQEMANLAENNLQYRTSSEMLMRKLSLIKYSITDGGK